MKKIAVIGAGNMGGALIEAIKKSDNYLVNVFDLNIDYAKKFESKNCIVYDDAHKAINDSQIVLMAVKPNIIFKVMDGIKESFKGKLVITIAAGIKIQQYKDRYEGIRIIRTMPNMPAQVLEGMTSICKDDNTNDEDLKIAQSVMNCAGKSLVIGEKYMDGATALAGSSPAYVFMMIEAMADAGVLEGLKRDEAYIFAAQAILGSAKLFLSENVHPGELKDRICSPGGTTIEAVKTLEETGFRNSLMEAIRVCSKKSRDLGK